MLRVHPLPSTRLKLMWNAVYPDDQANLWSFANSAAIRRRASYVKRFTRLSAQLHPMALWVNLVWVGPKGMVAGVQFEQRSNRAGLWEFIAKRTSVAVGLRQRGTLKMDLATRKAAVTEAVKIYNQHPVSFT